MNKYKSFIPVSFFNTEEKQWEKINSEKQNYLAEEEFYNAYESITELTDGVFYVTWLHSEEASIYYGKLEYTDEYQQVLEAELKELSKDFKFKL